MQIYDDAVSYVEKSPERFFRTGSSNPIELATHLLGDALIAGATAASIFRVDGWWVIGSDVDWLTNQNQHSIKDLFSRVVALPIAGPNSMRAEILLTAFTETVITVGINDCLTLKGDVPQDAEIWRVMKSQPRLKRLVAFRFDSEKLAEIAN